MALFRQWVASGIAVAGFFLVVNCLSAQEDDPFDVTLLVNPYDPQATDSGQGALPEPFRTIQAAASFAVKKALAGQSVRVLIQPGVYHESVRILGGKNEGAALIKLEGAVPGEVILRGSSPIDGWSIEKENVFEREWNPADYPDGNPMLFVEIARIEEVDSLAKVKPGKVFFDRASKRPKIYFLPPTGGTVRSGSIGIARMESAGILAESVNELILENLVIERGFHRGVSLRSCQAVLLNRVEIDYCRFLGVEASGGTTLRLRQVTANRCGEMGISVGGLRGLEITGSEVSLNGWSGAESAGGIVLLDCEQAKVWSLRVAENHGHGFLVDGGSRATKYSFVELHLLKNRGLGLRVMAPAGQAQIKGSQFAFNDGPGIVLGIDQARLSSTIFFGNAGPQIYLLPSGVVMLERGIAVAPDDEAVIELEPPLGYIGVSNLFFAPQNPTPFAVGQEGRINFARWQELTGSDLHSFYGDPQLVDPENYDFLPKPSSPFYQMKDWPVRELN